MTIRATKAAAVRCEFDAATVAGFAREFAAWRLGGCPGYGFGADLKARMTKAAKRAGRGYAELVVEVHRAAYAIIDADGRADVG